MSKIDIEKILFLDIETVPVTYSYSDLDSPTRDLWNKKWQHNPDISPAEQYAKAGIYAEFAKVICVGLGSYKQKSFYVSTIAGDDERKVLTELSDLLKLKYNSDDHILCAHNG